MFEMAMSEFEGPRGVRKEEVADLHALRGACFTGPPFNLNIGFRLFEDENLENLRVFLHEGRIVSHVGLIEFDLMMLGCRLKAACVGGVCTDEKHRGNRLAGRLLEDSWRRLRADGVDFVLISGDRSLYWREGCGKCRPTYVYMVPPSAEASAEVRASDPRRHLEEMQRIYSAEPVHFCRSREDLEGITRPWGERKDKAVFALLAGRAYVMGWRWPQQEGGGFIEVLEYAGDRKLLAEMAPAAAKEFGLPLRLHVPAWDEEFRRSLAGAGEEKEFANAWEGTVKVLSLDRLMEKTRRIWEAKAEKEAAERITFSQSGGSAQIILGSEALSLEGQEIAELVFGTTEERGWASDRPNLREALQRIFPLPGPRYGLNFI